MAMKKTATILIMISIFLAVPGSPRVFGQAADGDPSEFEAFRRQGVNLLYELDYDAATASFNEMVRLAPEHPAGYYYLATVKWLTILNSLRRLQTGLYSDDSFFSGGGDEVDQAQENEFRRMIQQSIFASKARLTANPRDVESLYFQGAAYGMLAGYEATVERRFKSSLDNAKRGVELHKKVVSLDPGFGEAYLSIGLYEFVVGNLSWAIRYGLKLVRVSGDKRKGMAMLQKALDLSRYGNEDAKVVLITVYRRDEQYDSALKLLDELIARHPQNYLNRLDRGDLLSRLGRYCESFTEFEAVLNDERSSAIRDLVRFQYGEALFKSGDRVRALEQFGEVARLPEADATLVTLAHLRIGQLHDLSGDHTAAGEQYTLVLSREDVFDSRKNAKRYSQKPYSIEIRTPAVCSPAGR